MQLEHGKLLIDQGENIKEIIENIYLDDSKPTFTPMSPEYYYYYYYQPTV